jgi:hypothetical protein
MHPNYKCVHQIQKHTPDTEVHTRCTCVYQTQICISDTNMHTVYKCAHRIQTSTSDTNMHTRYKCAHHTQILNASSFTSSSLISMNSQETQRILIILSHWWAAGLEIKNNTKYCLEKGILSLPVIDSYLPHLTHR